jgi:hypothetical protein
MMEKLTTCDIQDVLKLFSMVDKCARATEGYAWHMLPAQEAGKASQCDAGAAAQGSSNTNKNNKKKKAGGGNQPLAGAPTAIAAAAASGLGLMAHEVTSAPVKCSAAMMVAHDARCITPCATAQESAESSRSSRNSSVRNNSSHAKTARHPVSGRANKRWIWRRTRMRRWSSRMPRGH